MHGKHRAAAALLLSLLLSLSLCPAALADTDGTEPKITLAPDRLILQLGTRWSGVEFELRTDAGLFPVPIVVDETGVLEMDLGGSTTYTLTCLNSSVPIPDPTPPESAPSAPQQPAQTAQSGAARDPEAERPASGRLDLLPAAAAFIGILFVGAIALLLLSRAKKRRYTDFDEWEDEEDAL